MTRPTSGSLWSRFWARIARGLVRWLEALGGCPPLSHDCGIEAWERLQPYARRVAAPVPVPTPGAGAPEALPLRPVQTASRQGGHLSPPALP